MILLGLLDQWSSRGLIIIIRIRIINEIIIGIGNGEGGWWIIYCLPLRLVF